MSEETLAHRLRTRSEEARRRFLEPVNELAGLATALDLPHTAENLARTASDLHEDTFNLAVVGRFNNGKSTLLNALLGERTHPVGTTEDQGPLVTGYYPSTAVITTVSYNPEPTVEAIDVDGRREPWDWERYWNESTLLNRRAGRDGDSAGIREFQIGFPATLCEAGVVLLDTPGLDEDDLRTSVTRGASESCDAVIAVYRSEALMGAAELAQIEALADSGLHVFTVINDIDGRAGEELSEFVWNRYVHGRLGGPPYTGQDLAAHDIFIVDVERARRGRLSGDQAEIAASGLAALEARLADFLVNERQALHLDAYVREALLSIGGLEEQLRGRVHAMTSADGRPAKGGADPASELRQIRHRVTSLEDIFHSYAQRTVAALTVSLHAEIEGLRKELPALIGSLDLDLGRLTGVLQAKRASETLNNAISSLVVQRLNAWSDGMAQRLLAPLLTELSQRLSEEVSTLGHELTAVRLRLGWDELTAERISPVEHRTLAAVAGFSLGELGAGLAHGVGGWRGAAGGTVASSLLVGVLGVAPLVLPAVAVAAAVAGAGAAGSHRLADRIKRSTLDEADAWLAALPTRALPRLTAHVHAEFDAIRGELLGSVNALIDEEEQLFSRSTADSAPERAQREAALAHLHDALARVTDGRARLKQVASPGPSEDT
ncbi:dynamin family protein [Streptomyces cupreus]|uniref:Dynamin family protein n=1 Tax=Streptomyces cupreus TaxID=2759956 RepID=A0A7X1MFP2_9ACTN|nr:dynamin family protein [Streptomyces cupreus]MBC2906910.1 dynamin family protein [Streptomyces cupreus]